MVNPKMNWTEIILAFFTALTVSGGGILAVWRQYQKDLQDYRLKIEELSKAQSQSIMTASRELVVALINEQQEQIERLKEELASERKARRDLGAELEQERIARSSLQRELYEERRLREEFQRKSDQLSKDVERLQAELHLLKARSNDSSIT